MELQQALHASRASCGTDSLQLESQLLKERAKFKLPFFDTHFKKQRCPCLHPAIPVKSILVPFCLRREEDFLAKSELQLPTRNNLPGISQGAKARNVRCSTQNSGRRSGTQPCPERVSPPLLGLPSCKGRLSSSPLGGCFQKAFLSWTASQLEIAELTCPSWRCPASQGASQRASEDCASCLVT